MSTPTHDPQGLPPFGQYAQQLQPGTLGTTDTMATQTLASHQLSASRFTALGDAYVCTCGWRGVDGPLHLVEMGVEAGVAAMAELRDREHQPEPPELTLQELAQRDLVGHLAAARRTNPDSWRDTVASLVDAAASQQSLTADLAVQLGGHLWSELEQWEAWQAEQDDPAPTTTQERPTMDGPDTLPLQSCGAADTHDAHSWGMHTGQLGAEGHRAWCTGSAAGQLLVVSCPEGRPHQAHVWLMAVEPELPWETAAARVQCDGQPG